MIYALFDQTGNFSIESGCVELASYGSKNAGRFIVQARGTLTFSGSLGHNFIAQGSASVAGTISVTAGATVAMQSGSTLKVTGETLVDGGLLDLQAGCSLLNIGALFNITSAGTADFHDANVVGTSLDIGGTLRTSQNVSASTGFILRETGLQVGGTVDVNCKGYVVGGTHSVGGQLLAHDDFTLMGGTLTGTAPLVTEKRFYWLGGQLYNLVSGVRCLNGLTIDTPTPKLMSLTTLYNLADAVWNAGNINGWNGATIVNSPASTASFHVNLTKPYSFTTDGGGTPSVFFNNATFTCANSNTTTATLNFNFHNNIGATVDVISGQLELAGGGYNNGTMNFGRAATLSLGGTFSLLANSTFTGFGKAILSGTVTVNSLFNVSGSTEVSAGQVDFNAKASLADFGNPLIGTLLHLALSWRLEREQWTLI